MDGLIIKEKWLNLIIENTKSLEVRGSKTSKLNEPIYLLESKTNKIKGIATITECIEIDEHLWNTMKEKHCVKTMSYEELLKRYKKPYFWVLSSVKKLDTINYYKHPAGAVIWVKNVQAIEKRR